MDAHHGDVCRFANADRDDYEQVSFNLIKLVKSAIRASEEQVQNARTYEGPSSKRALACMISKYSSTNISETNNPVGLGGAGKSQIAIRYKSWHLKKHRDTSIFWIHVSSIDRFSQGYLAIAKDRNLPGMENPYVDYLTLVNSWLSNKESGGWLMVIDISDEDDMFFGAETKSWHKSVPEGSTIQIKPMDEDQSIELFRKHFKGKEISTNLIAELVRELDYLPLVLALVLAQAAAFMQQRSTTISGYLKLYKKSDDKWQHSSVRTSRLLEETLCCLTPPPQLGWFLLSTSVEPIGKHRESSHRRFVSTDVIFQYRCSEMIRTALEFSTFLSDSDQSSALLALQLSGYLNVLGEHKAAASYVEESYLWLKRVVEISMQTP
ncbi:hypothetical protein BKA65DRAFT_543760 [Rhexocercosporidium sp. MPI-PUGE-AT-0058]|nr:hypothetical protein BKA65DRAFT_543760 [Rhexocercosporidium sp. MPI-PUGE-AT-0058]